MEIVGKCGNRASRRGTGSPQTTFKHRPDHVVSTYRIDSADKEVCNN